MNEELSGIANMLAAQRLYFEKGETRPVDKRLESLKRLKEEIKAQMSAIESALWNDLHKSAYETYLTETSLVLQEIDMYLKFLRKWAKVEKVPTPFYLLPSGSRIVKEPYGLVLVMSPWNYPLQLSFAPLIAAVAAGNVVTLKPSEDAPHAAEVMKKIIENVFDQDHVRVLNGGLELSKTLLKERFDYIFFTGSPKTGRIVMEAAVPHLTPVTLELGGKSPCIVDKSADIKVAAKRIVWGKFLNCGQTCIAPDYLLVHAAVKDSLIKEMISFIHSFYGQDAAKSPDYPRIINGKAFDRLIHLIGNEKILYGGTTNRNGKYIEPTLLLCESMDAPVMQEEIFGPVLPVIEIGKVEDAVRYINTRDKPLALYYFGDRETANDVISRTSSGGVCINDTILHVANLHLPFGGVGESGMGSYHGRAGFDTFTHKRSVLSSKTWIDFGIKFPPYKGLNFLKKLM